MGSQDKADAILARFPGPVTLRPSRLKWIFILLICVAFAVGGYFMAADGKTIGWWILAFFGLGVPVSIAAMLPGAGGLTLDRGGFEVVNLFRRQSYTWAEVSGFKKAQLVYQNEMVVFDHAGAKGKMIASVNTGLVGRNAGLPDTYGFSTDVLADLMARWRDRAMG